MMSFCLLFSFALSFGMCVGLLFNNTGLPSGGATSLSDRHFVTLVDMITEEKQARRQLEQYVIQQNKELTALKDQLNKQATPKENGSLLNDLLVEKNETQLLIEKLEQMRMDYSLLQQENHQLISDNQRFARKLDLVENKTINLTHELSQWKSSVTGLRISNITCISEKLKMTEATLNSLMSSNNARKQDFMALLNQTKESTSRISVLETTQLGMSSRVNLLANNQTLTIGKLEALRYRMNEKVALTACAQDSRYTGSDIIRFPVHKTVIGIQNISDFDTTGQFTCESDGLYMVSVSILSNTMYANFAINVNNSSMIAFSVKGGEVGGGNNYDFGTAVILVSLTKNDKVSIGPNLSGNFHVFANSYSCLTILKIK